MELVLSILCVLIIITSLVLWRWKSNESLFEVLLALLVLVQVVLLGCRSVNAQHPPFTNLYETFMLLPFLISLRLLIWKKQTPYPFRVWTFAGVAFFHIVTLLLPESMKTPRPLMPALNSFWMYIHVPAYFFGYMAMFLAFIYVIVLLVNGRKQGAENSVLSHLLDNEVKIGFFFLNLGLITGAVWAYVSWGNYWGWDPKEVWALINILVLAYYFHLNKVNHRKKSWIVIITFLTIAFTYWGVSFILAGLHSYA